MPAGRRKPGRKNSRKSTGREPAESRASEALTIAWTVSVTGALVADLMLLAAHLYVRSYPEAQRAKFFAALLLLLASGMGAVSLGLLPAVWRTRRLKPPQGYVVFALVVAVTPILAMVARLFG